MTTTPTPLAAPLIIASLTIPVTPSDEVIDTMIDIIECFGRHFTADERDSILTALQRHTDEVRDPVTAALERIPTLPSLNCAFHEHDECQARPHANCSCRCH